MSQPTKLPVSNFTFANGTIRERETLLKKWDFKNTKPLENDLLHFNFTNEQQTYLMTKTSSLEDFQEALKIVYKERNFNQLQSDSVGNMISCFSIILLVITCVTFAIFWTVSARLMTDPNFMVIQPDYATKTGTMDMMFNDTNYTIQQDIVCNSTNSVTRTEIEKVTFLILLTEFVRNYITVLGIPLAVLWFSNVSANVRSSKDEYVFDSFIFVCLWGLVGCAVVISCCSVGLLVPHSLAYGACNDQVAEQDKVNWVWAELACTTAQCFIWLLTSLCFYLLRKEKKPLQVFRTMFCFCCGKEK